jgi:hypothetical protein
VGGLNIIKMSLFMASWWRAHALLPVLGLAAKSAARIPQWTKSVCFWQRLKQPKTEKTFAGQGAY